jgi:hypothetical protein
MMQAHGNIELADGAVSGVMKKAPTFLDCFIWQGEGMQ